MLRIFLIMYHILNNIMKLTLFFTTVKSFFCLSTVFYIEAVLWRNISKNINIFYKCYTF